jgi:hypothetical protein
MSKIFQTKLALFGMTLLVGQLCKLRADRIGAPSSRKQVAMQVALKVRTAELCLPSFGFILFVFTPGPFSFFKVSDFGNGTVW